jgi:esterase/lipase
MDRELIEIVIEIFLDSLKPYLETISTWFTESANRHNSADWSYDMNEVKLPKFLKPYMTEILHIRKSLMVIQIVRDEHMIGVVKHKNLFEQYRTW